MIEFLKQPQVQAALVALVVACLVLAYKAVRNLDAERDNKKLELDIQKLELEQRKNELVKASAVKGVQYARERGDDEGLKGPARAELAEGVVMSEHPDITAAAAAIVVRAVVGETPSIGASSKPPKPADPTPSNLVSINAAKEPA